MGFWHEDPRRPKLISHSVQLADPTAPFECVLSGELVLRAMIVNSTNASKEVVAYVKLDSGLHLPLQRATLNI